MTSTVYNEEHEGEVMYFIRVLSSSVITIGLLP